MSPVIDETVVAIKQERHVIKGVYKMNINTIQHLDIENANLESRLWFLLYKSNIGHCFIVCR